MMAEEQETALVPVRHDALTTKQYDNKEIFRIFRSLYRP